MAQLLTEAGSALDPDGVAELIAGVLAAPPEIGTSWHALVADPTPPALAEALEELRAWLAEDWRDGLAPRGFRPAAARAPGVAMLREELAARGLDGFVVPRADEHQGEYVPRCAQRLAWLTGFTGSAGHGDRAGATAPRSSSTAAIRLQAARAGRYRRCSRSGI